MIGANSRYAQSVVTPAVNLDGKDVMAVVFTPPVDTFMRYTYYQVTGADTIDGIASNYYGDPTLWWMIANANPEVQDWLTMTTGRLLRIPVPGSVLT